MGIIRDGFLTPQTLICLVLLARCFPLAKRAQSKEPEHGQRTILFQPDGGGELLTSIAKRARLFCRSMDIPVHGQPKLINPSELTYPPPMRR